ncbi:hypothetical protein Tco_0884527 [Tanacetum coccineum]
MKSSKGFVCEFEAKVEKEIGSVEAMVIWLINIGSLDVLAKLILNTFTFKYSLGHLYGLPRLMGQLGLCLPMAQTAMEKVGGNKNKGLKLSRSPSAVCGPPV